MMHAYTVVLLAAVVAVSRADKYSYFHIAQNQRMQAGIMDKLTTSSGTFSVSCRSSYSP